MLVIALFVRDSWATSSSNAGLFFPKGPIQQIGKVNNKGN